MTRRVIPVNVTKGRADVPARLAALDASQRSAVLATESGGQPYLSLMSFALTGDGTGVILATPKATTKYRNMLKNPRVSLLIDDRSNTASDITRAEAVTITGTARPLRRGKRKDDMARVLASKHPSLKGFIEADTTAIVHVDIEWAVHVGGFQEVTVWQPGK